MRGFQIVAHAVLAATFFICSWAVAGPAIPLLTGPVEDMANVISPQEKALLNSEIRDLYAKTSVQIQILTIRSLEGEAIESFSIHVAEKWRIGNPKQDSGLLLVFSLSDRKVRIEVGRGLEGIFTDLETSHMIRELLVPHFREGNYGAGVQEFVQASRSMLTHSGEYQTKNSGSGSRLHSQLGFGRPLVLLVIVIMGVLLFALDDLLRDHTLLRGGLSAGALAPIPILAWVYPSIGIPVGIALILPFFGFLLGLLGIWTVLRLLLETSGMIGGGSGGGWSSGGGGWSGGGGSFSGGGSSGSW